MSRFVAGLALLYVCAVTGQQDLNTYRGRATNDKTSIAIASINGGSYPPGAFSIGYGGETIGADGRPVGSYGVYRPTDEDYGNGPSGGINGDFGHSHTGNNGYDQTGYRPAKVPVNNYDDRPYAYNDYGRPSVAPPLSNSAKRHTFYDSLVRFLLSWF